MATDRPSCYGKKATQSNLLLLDQTVISDYQRPPEPPMIYSWSTWSNQPCAAGCNTVGIQVQERKCIGKNSLGIFPAKGNCKGSDKNALLCIGMLFKSFSIVKNGPDSKTRPFFLRRFYLSTTRSSKTSFPVKNIPREHHSPTATFPENFKTRKF